MKTKISNWMIFILRGFLQGLYFFLKLFPVKQKKVVFCSRQSNQEPLDFRLLRQSLNAEDPEIITESICCHIGHRISDYIRFAKCLLQSMYHLATCRVCVLDSYWPAVSMLNHKRNLTVIQIWHAIGKIKKSGYQTLGKTSGRKSVYAKALCMHDNYDYVIAGAPIWNPFYCQSFHIAEKKLLNYGLPRIDYLLENENKNREKFFQEYPELKNKKIVLYAPTFRKNMKSRWDQILNAPISSDSVFIIKNHPGQHVQHKSTREHVYYMDNWKTIDLLAVCDCVITDYSAITLEAAVLKKPVYFWLYDYKEYMENNGLNLDLQKVCAPYVYHDLEELVDSLRIEKYNTEFLDDFRVKYLPSQMGSSTNSIVQLIISKLGKGQVSSKIYTTVKQVQGALYEHKA